MLVAPPLGDGGFEVLSSAHGPDPGLNGARDLGRGYIGHRAERMLADEDGGIRRRPVVVTEGEPLLDGARARDR